jgi:hypothetical protein
MSLREKIIRIITLPIFLAGMCWFWIRTAFVKGYDWEEMEFFHLND